MSTAAGYIYRRLIRAVLCVCAGADSVASDLRNAFASGYSSVKVYMTYDSLKLHDEELYACFRQDSPPLTVSQQR